MSREDDDAIVNTFAALAGGVGGALASELLVQLGIKPVFARAGVAIAGSLGATMLDGRLRHAAGGAAAAGVSQLALAYVEAERSADEDIVSSDAPADVMAEIEAEDTVDSERNAAQGIEVDDEVLEEARVLGEEIGAGEGDDVAEVFCDESAEPALILPLRNACARPARSGLPQWLPVALLVALAFLPIVLERVT